ncbi:5-formyltetrahydrofolate cyclo-ligase [Roseateles sp. BYS180W]|uniref:5-formyltetrahydrofolate cyclo-ligase n=1 Tax=Roseateles rivi TaxID=3299028 RepID=A0ABW7FWP0_9BURK
MHTEHPHTPGTAAAAAPGSHDRDELRRHLLAQRRAWHESPQAQAAQARVALQLLDVLRQLEPLSLGLYWPLPGEFDVVNFAQSHALGNHMQLALPYAWRAGARMEFRHWSGQPPTMQDECGIPSCEGPALVPEVLLVPCVGHTREGYRMGYGGGYFDRWLAAHPGVTAVGLSWAAGEQRFEVAPHDIALTVVITEAEVLAP